MNVHLDPTKRHDAVFLFDVENGNPNGDPDNGNMPRFDPNTMIGLVTDGAIKRKVRDYAQLVHGKEIFIQSQFSLNNLILDAYRKTGVEPPQVQVSNDDFREWLQENEVNASGLYTMDGSTLTYLGESMKENDIKKALGGISEEDSDKEQKKLFGVLAKDIARAGKTGVSRLDKSKAREELTKRYYDIRMFGAVLSTGLNAGQVRGAMQVTPAKSINPISPMDLSITRVAITREADRDRKETEMGRKPMIPYGLYRAHIFYNPFLTSKTGAEVTSSDLEVFWDALCNMFDFDRSAARGEMATRGLYVFTHENQKGNAPTHKLLSKVMVKPRNGSQGDEDKWFPKGIDDYSINVDLREITLPGNRSVRIVESVPDIAKGTVFLTRLAE